MTTITTVQDLETLYGEVGEASIAKETDRVVPVYRAFIEASPFAALATRGPEGLDCSPRGDGPGFIRVQDEKTLLLPDRRGNNRIDSLRNIVRDPQVALLFLIPGIGETLRVNGRADISVDPALLDSFVVDGKAPKTVLVIHVEAVYFQCSRAIVRADLWNPDKRVSRKAVPSPGEMLAALSENRIGGESYDKALPERVKTTLY
ncbi:pyridoxamine 5'-phosphate oxidase family protein [Microvirga terricola]|uniref:Pyridoxamine 5'-phosphate oxidase family protein n=1 Tax=Microvirga terricola TaxID=2719797 RepID=A0ABX0V6V0_9HYPH|nr:pyridoxamine 5'-phosphate oxidase family protein [Microvirga terricola]NIX75565.1 pyridoxamine 5'-phosphate oxidase family protein [Microvirga terricola]